MRSRRSSVALGGFVAASIGVFLFVLPALAATEAMARRLAAAERAGIDPGAVFYTDHPAASHAPARPADTAE